jgi:hypothetical protein
MTSFDRYLDRGKHLPIGKLIFISVEGVAYAESRRGCWSGGRSDVNTGCKIIDNVNNMAYSLSVEAPPRMRDAPRPPTPGFGATSPPTLSFGATRVLKFVL